MLSTLVPTPKGEVVKSKEHLAVFDFDHTLFNVQEFVEALSLAAQSLYGITPTTFKGELDSFYQTSEIGERIGYDIIAHFGHHSVDLKQPDTRQSLVNEILALHLGLTGQATFLYPEVAQAIARLRLQADTDVVIVTVNTDTGMNFKLLLCGDVLDGIPVRVVSGNKGHVLSAEWHSGIVFNGIMYRSVTAVDDSADQIEAFPDHPDVERHQLVRPGQKNPANISGIRIIQSVSQIESSGQAA